MDARRTDLACIGSTLSLTVAAGAFVAPANAASPAKITSGKRVVSAGTLVQGKPLVFTIHSTSPGTWTPTLRFTVKTAGRTTNLTIAMRPVSSASTTARLTAVATSAEARRAATLFAADGAVVSGRITGTLTAVGTNSQTVRHTTTFTMPLIMR